MNTQQATPTELLEWVNERIRVLDERLRASKRAARIIADRKQYVLELLDAVADIEATSERMVHLLTAYALQEGVASGTEVSKASKVTFTGATSRVAGRIARSAWDEVWPKEQEPPAGI